MGQLKGRDLQHDGVHENRMAVSNSTVRHLDVRDRQRGPRHARDIAVLQGPPASFDIHGLHWILRCLLLRLEVGSL
jgi:hypothetical protein